MSRIGLIAKINMHLYEFPQAELTMREAAAMFGYSLRSVQSRMQEYLQQPDCRLEKVTVIRVKRQPTHGATPATDARTQEQ